MKVLALMLAMMTTLSGCGEKTPSNSESGACYHPSDGGLHNTKAECDKHNGTWG